MWTSEVRGLCVVLAFVRHAVASADGPTDLRQICRNGIIIASPVPCVTTGQERWSLAMQHSWESNNASSEVAVIMSSMHV